MPKRKKSARSVEALTHTEESRKNLPSAEHQPLLREEERNPYPVHYERRNRDLDPQLVWRGKDEQDLADLVVNVPPLYIQERVHPKALVDDLRRYSDRLPVAGGRSSAAGGQDAGEQVAQGSFADFFADFNGLPSPAAATEFYQHDANWSNRMILGDSLQVMASLAEREGLRGQVQCIYLDPPYGIKFNSNFQWSTTSRDVRDGKLDHVTREPEQVKAFRDTWRDGIHSYLTYLRDRLTVARDLLTESGSIFVQIGDENVHRVRALMDEVFGDERFVANIVFQKTSYKTSNTLQTTFDHILWYAKRQDHIKARQLYFAKIPGGIGASGYSQVELSDGRRVRVNDSLSLRDSEDSKVFELTSLISGGGSSKESKFEFEGEGFTPGQGQHWKTTLPGMQRLAHANRVVKSGNRPRFVHYLSDYAVSQQTDNWLDTRLSSFGDEKQYVVQTGTKIIERCILMTTDAGDLVLDPTCGSGTTAYVAEQWGRRWITIDTSRVALALARARIMGARYPYYLLADSPAGQAKEAELTDRAASEADTYGRLRQGFVYERVPHITLRAIANNAEIDVIWEEYEEKLAPLRERLSEVSGQWSVASGQEEPATGRRPLEEWEVPRERPGDWPPATDSLLAAYWELRIARQQEIDGSIARNADYEYLYDKPYEDRSKVRVAGPFTVESISPHRVLAVDENDEFVEGVAEPKGEFGETVDFPSVILDNLRASGVQQAHKEDRITFTSVTPWPGRMVCAEGRYEEVASGQGSVASEESGEGSVASGESEERGVGLATGHSPLTTSRRAAIFIGPEFGTVSRADLFEAAVEAADGRFDVLISCAFNYEAHTTEFESLGRVPVLKARMNPDLHMADELKNTGNGNLFVIFGEPDIDILDADDGQIRVKINGVDVFNPSSGDVHSDDPNRIPCWFIDTDYNEESFFVRHAYFPGTNNDPYKSLKTTLKAEINREVWETLRSDTSRPFDRPESGRIAVKVINHLGDEVMKVFRV